MTSIKFNLPENLRPLFWDVDFQTVGTQKHSSFIIARIMELGDEPEVRYMLTTFTRDKIIKAFRGNRSLSQRSRNFWRLFLDLEEPACIPKPYPTPFGIS